MTTRMIGTRRAYVREAKPGVRVGDGGLMTGDFKVVESDDSIEFYFNPLLPPASAALILFDAMREAMCEPSVPTAGLTDPGEASDAA
jgi:hypothetical protein